MDIWEWVIRLEDDLEEAGQEHASRIIEQLSTEILELNIAKADALIPEAIALSRSLNNPWLEVFMRHWEMRNRIGNKSEGESALADVVSLFEFAHRDETITCPQTVCVTQDLSACYANIDGPGWVEERIAVCEETFQRITPKWNCFHCLSCEYADALLDDNKPEEALAFLKIQADKVVEVGEEVSEAMHTFEIQSLLKLGRSQEAFEIIEQCEANIQGYDWPVNKQDRQILKAHVLASLGRAAEGWEVLPGWNYVVPRYYMGWVKAINVLVKHTPERNTWQLASALQTIINHFLEVGAHRRVIDVAAIQIQLSLMRGSIWSAKRALQDAYKTLPKLKAPKGADQLLENFAKQIAEASATVTLPVPAEELLEWLSNRAQESKGRNPEEEVEWLLLALKALPDDEALVDVTSSALQACAAHEEAQALLWEYIDRYHEQESNLPYYLLNMLVKQGKFAEIDRLAHYYEHTQPQVFLWCKAQQAVANDDWRKVQEISLKMHEVVPDYLGPVRLLVSYAVRQKDFIEAAKWQTTLVEKTDEPQNDLWDLLTYTAAAQQWEQARQIANQLDIKLDSTEGVIEEDWGWVRIEVLEDGETIEYLAKCTGPVTARIQELARPAKTQRSGDWVVFDAQQLAVPPEDEEERKYFIPLYRLVATLDVGNLDKSWFVDGVYPGDELFGVFDQSLEALGWKIWVNSNRNYTLTDGFDLQEESLPGIYFSVAAPKGVTAAEIDNKLSELTADWEYPLCWLNLAKAAGVPLEPHQEIISRFHL